MLDGFPVTVLTTSTEETEALGAELARRLLEDSALPRFIAMRGDLGVGKTALVRGAAAVIAPGAAVRSPTFALVNEYRAAGRPPLFHFDMYRITSEDDLYSIGYDDYLSHPTGICMVEWSEHIPYGLPEDYLTLTIEKCDPATPDIRRITLERVN